jgi:hypothetical protein
MAEEKDEELEAISTVLGVLGPLKLEARGNVIDYVFRRLGITPPAAMLPATPPAYIPPAQATPGTPAALAPPTDLRTLTEQKSPKTANQMVAIVAYYLANYAPAGERRDYIVAEDIKKYFVQANYELPTAPPRMTLVNAKNAGYLDAVKDGQYRLNPVGHNLVAHKLPRGDGGLRKTTKKPRAKAKAKKKSRK